MVVEDDACGRDEIEADHGLDCFFPNPANKVFFLFLPQIKVLVALIIAIHHPGLTGCQDLAI